MFFEIIFGIILGCMFGVVTGLVPGIHVNLVSILLIGISPFLLSFTSPIVLAVFVISLALTHTFLDSIPSIFLGAPDPDMALSVLPGHRMLLDGKGYEAVKLTVIGSLLCLIATLALIPFVVDYLEVVYTFISPFMGRILLGVVVWMILLERGTRGKFIGFYVFMQGGVLGLLVLNMPGLEQALFPMLSGLFGVSTLLLSLGDKVVIPKPKKCKLRTRPMSLVKIIPAGVFAGSLTGLFPGLGAAQASIIGMMIVGKINMYAFLALVGGINTVNFAFSMGTFYALSKARNGAIVAVMELVDSIGFDELMLFIGTALVAGGIATFLALRIGKVFSTLIRKVNYRALVLCIIGFIVVLVIVICGWLGLLVLVVSTFVGMIPALIGVKRSHNMGCLLLPVIIFFLV